LVPEWPDSPLDFKTALQMLRCFDQAHSTVEDGQRSAMYVAERMRQDDLKISGSLDAWLESLEVCVTAEPIKVEDLDRASQLLNKTNQMNIRTRRMTRDEIWAWSQQPRNALATIRVSDKYGDYGLVGIVSFTLDSGVDGEAELVDFILSCRAMGRKVEESMVHIVSSWANARGANGMRAKYYATPKNQPCLRFFEGLALLESSAENAFRLKDTKAFPQPAGIRLTFQY
jgi:FkbH-like protein